MLQCPSEVASLLGLLNTGKSLQPGGHFLHKQLLANDLKLRKSNFASDSNQKYGKKGERQNGIDIIDMAGGTPFRAAQCKLHEPHLTCPPKEIRDEVKEAIGSEHDIDEFYILTSGRKTVYADKEVIKINRRRDPGQTFTTYIWSWQEIETKLDELDPITRDQVLNAGKNSSLASFEAILRKLNVKFATDSEPSSNPYLQTKFTLVEKHLKNHDRVLAKYELEQIDDMPAASQNANDRYLVHRLNAKCLMLDGQFDEGAHRFLKAYDEQPQVDQARINRSLALELLGKKDKAWEQASELLREGIRTEPLPTIAYRTAPRPHSDEVKGWYEDHLDTSEELNLTLADEARQDGRPEDSIRYADKAIEINPDSARGFALRGFAYHNLALNDNPERTAKRLAQAESDYLHVRAMTGDPLPDGLMADVCRNLGNVRFLLGRPNPEEAFEDAIAKANEKSPYVEQYLSFLCSRHEFVTANRVLREHGIDESNLDQRFLKLVVERNDETPDRQVDFIDAMADLYSQGEFQRRDECLGFIVQWSVDDSKVQQGIERLQRMQSTLDPFEFSCCMAWLQHVGGDDEKAIEHANAARRLLKTGSPPNYVALLARLFMDMGDDEQALPLLVQAADRTRLTAETRALLDCAQRMQQHDVIRETCQLLRINQADTEATRSMELQILFGYVPKEAAELIRELIDKHPDDPGLYAWHCHIDTRLHGRYEDLDETRLPKPDGLNVYEAHRVLAPLLALERYSAVVRFAYEVLRHNQGDETRTGGICGCSWSVPVRAIWI